MNAAQQAMAKWKVIGSIMRRYAHAQKETPGYPVTYMFSREWVVTHDDFKDIARQIERLTDTQYGSNYDQMTTWHAKVWFMTRDVLRTGNAMAVAQIVFHRVKHDPRLWHVQTMTDQFWRRSISPAQRFATLLGLWEDVIPEPAPFPPGDEDDYTTVEWKWKLTESDGETREELRQRLGTFDNVGSSISDLDFRESDWNAEQNAYVVFMHRLFGLGYDRSKPRTGWNELPELCRYPVRSTTNPPARALYTVSPRYARENVDNPNYTPEDDWIELKFGAPLSWYRARPLQTAFDGAIWDLVSRGYTSLGASESGDGGIEIGGTFGSPPKRRSPANILLGGAALIGLGGLLTLATAAAALGFRRLR